MRPDLLFVRIKILDGRRVGCDRSLCEFLYELSYLQPIRASISLPSNERSYVFPHVLERQVVQRFVRTFPRGRSWRRGRGRGRTICPPLYIPPERHLRLPRIKRHGSNCGFDPFAYRCAYSNVRYELDGSSTGLRAGFWDTYPGAPHFSPPHKMRVM